MRTTLCCTLSFVAAAALAVPAHARETMLRLPIKRALETPDAKAKLHPNVRLFFGKQPHPATSESLGEFTTNKKTNAFNKGDVAACEWTFLSAVLALQERAQKQGGNAVVAITSYYDKNYFVSETEYQCGAGNILAGVALKGTVVKLK